MHMFTSPPLRIPDAGRRWVHMALVIVFGASAVIGVWGVYERVAHGHLPAGYGSYVPWGLWIALYFHGVGIAGGAFLLGGLGYVLRWPGFRRRAALRTVIVLSVAAFAASFLGIWFDLGHMDRASFIFTRPAFTSMMSFNAWIYGAFMACAGIAYALSWIDDRGWLKPFLCVAALFSVMFPSQSGAFFGVVDAKSYWHSPLLPVLFLTSAVVAGSATLLLVKWLFPDGEIEMDGALRRLRSILLGSLIVYFGLELAEFSLGLWNPYTHAPALELILWGPYWWVFWIVHLVVGGGIPFALLLTRRVPAWLTAAGLIVVAFVSGRLNVLIPGQAVGEISGLQDAFHHDRLKYIYHATPAEYAVGFFMLAAGMAVFFVGREVTRLIARRLSASTPVLQSSPRAATPAMK